MKERDADDGRRHEQRKTRSQSRQFGGCHLNALGLSMATEVVQTTKKRKRLSILNFHCLRQKATTEFGSRQWQRSPEFISQSPSQSQSKTETSVAHHHTQLQQFPGTTKGQAPQTCSCNRKLGGSSGQKPQYWSARFTPVPATTLPINKLIVQTCLGQYPQFQRQMSTGPHQGRQGIHDQ